MLGIFLYGQESQAMLRAFVAVEEITMPCLRRVIGSIRPLSSDASELRKGHNPTGKFDHSHDRLAVDVDLRYDLAFLRKGFMNSRGKVVKIKETSSGVFGHIETEKKKFRAEKKINNR